MKVFESYSQGIKRATIEIKMVFLLWLINILFAVGIYPQFSNYLNKTISRSIAAENFIKYFDLHTFFELLIHQGDKFSAIISFTGLLIIGYILASVFLNGGILFTLIHPKKANQKRRLAPVFFQGGGKFFGRFLRLVIYSLVLWIGIGIVMLIIHLILSPITKGSTNESLMLGLFLVRGAIALFLVFLVKMILDYTRIKIVIQDTRKVFLSMWQAVGFVFRKLGSTLALYYLYVLTAFAIFILYWWAQKAVKTHSLLPILIAFVIGQIFILSRGWLRIGLQAAQMKFFQAAKTKTSPIE